MHHAKLQKELFVRAAAVDNERHAGRQCVSDTSRTLVRHSRRGRRKHRHGARWFRASTQSCQSAARPPATPPWCNTAWPRTYGQLLTHGQRNSKSTSLSPGVLGGNRLVDFSTVISLHFYVSLRSSPCGEVFFVCCLILNQTKPSRAVKSTDRSRPGCLSGIDRATFRVQNFENISSPNRRNLSLNRSIAVWPALFTIAIPAQTAKSKTWKSSAEVCALPSALQFIILFLFFIIRSTYICPDTSLADGLHVITYSNGLL